jgi:NAD(P)-dependent dehydrogenase (short-subunit alcohol dehydrogenase family)
VKPVPPLSPGALPRARLDRESLSEKIAETTAFLEALRDDYEALAILSLEERSRFLKAAGEVARPGPWAKRELAAAARERYEATRKKADESILAETGMRQSRRQRVFTPWLHGGSVDRNTGTTKGNILDRTREAEAPPAAVQLAEEVHCYTCKKKYREVHFFYDALCPACAALNWEKRTPSADLRGRVAVVTGARVKIGFHCALMLLRSGARVIVTTRFPRDAAARYAAVEDFASFADRLEIFGLDLRHTPSVDRLARFLDGHLPRLDFIINNACQTVRRPAGFYEHLMQGEGAAPPEACVPLLAAYESMRETPVASGALVAAGNAVGLRDPAALSQLALLEEDLDRSTHIFPSGALDADLQQVDLREVNSWRLPLAEVSAVELLEVQLVNAVAPFILNARLKPLMLRTDNRDKHIVNVSAVEGQFSRRLKTDRHPHTNMAKAALNMMTRTSAADYVADGIHMNSVDTGWVTDEDPAHHAERKARDHGFSPPLDIVDGAARVVDPIFVGINTGVHCWGAFLKDYAPTDW